MRLKQAGLHMHYTLTRRGTVNIFCYMCLKQEGLHMHYTLTRRGTVNTFCYMS
jgi:hypothetical protein